MSKTTAPSNKPAQHPKARAEPPTQAESKPAKSGGTKGPDPTRYGDWEKDGRCVDF